MAILEQVLNFGRMISPTVFFFESDFPSQFPLQLYISVYISKRDCQFVQISCDIYWNFTEIVEIDMVNI